ncbi:MAG: hypothetical protein EAX87_02655 [Candidatus Thorarchaeota archaeon]|nr:hypothetical protein [Candidatus Thorarchaeota archaeon]
MSFEVDSYHQEHSSILRSISAEEISSKSNTIQLYSREKGGLKSPDILNGLIWKALGKEYQDA